MWLLINVNISSHFPLLIFNLKTTLKVKKYTCHASHVQLFVIPWPVARQAPLSMGFSRQKYWSRLPCPPPGDLPNPGIEPRSPALWADALLSELSGKPKNTGVGSLSLLQGIFPIQESNWGLLHCRQILYQLSYQGSPQNCYINWVYSCTLALFPSSDHFF